MFMISNMMLMFKLSFIFVLVSLDLDFLKFLPMILPLMLSMAFLTLLESKVLAAMQRSSGPNVVGIFGLLQAFADGVKLMLKETLMPSSSNFMIFLLSPMFMFSLSLYGWALMPFVKGVVISDLDLGLLILLAMSSLSVYGVIMSGWSSNSKYALLGALSSSAQMISYEVSMGLLMMPVLALSESLNLTAMVLGQDFLFNCWPFMCSFVLFFICILAETNSLPFDLPEAESELVSGYNVEYSALTFALFFLAEYSYMILMSSLLVMLFLGGWLPLLNFFLMSWLPGWFWFFLKLMFMLFCFIWVRATLPSYSYDQLMSLGWKVMLPLSLGLLFFYLAMMLMF